MKTVITILIIAHVYLITRYCVSKLFPKEDLDEITKLKRLIIVAFIPFFGYYYVSKLEK
jgi:Na+-driven multidrug efflux pump